VSWDLRFFFWRIDLHLVLIYGFSRLGTILFKALFFLDTTIFLFYFQQNNNLTKI
jgi:hypothetical protein